MKNFKYTIFCLALTANLLHAEETSPSLIPNLDDALDYKIGVNNSYKYRFKNPTIDLDMPGVQWDMNGSCSGWDVGVSVDGLLNDLDSKFNRLEKDMYNAVGAFVVSLPALIAQRLDPALYETVSSGLIKAEDIYDVSAQSCQAMSERFSQGNGLGEMADQSFWLDIGEQTNPANGGNENKDLVKTMNESEANKGEKGVTGGDGEKCGGKNMPVCDGVKEAVNNAMEQIVASANTGSNAPSGADANSVLYNQEPWIYKIWGDAEEAEQWIVNTVGKVTYSLCEECDKFTHIPGIGVYQEIAYETEETLIKLAEVIDGEDVPDEETLDAISSNDFKVNKSVIFALREEGGNSIGNVFATRIAEDIALMKTVDKLLAGRRLLLLGLGNSNFEKNKLSKEIVEKRIELLSEELSLIKEELELKRSARGDTIITLLNRRAARDKDLFKDGNSSFDKKGLEKINKYGGRN